MRTHIPAHTQITCDRCKKSIDAESFERLVVNPNYLEEAADAEFDLCGECVKAFQAFIEGE